jgi:hypothetical protein
MLNQSEKAYCQALQALQNKQYRQAAGFFDRAKEFFASNEEFNLLSETTSLLVALKLEIAAADVDDDDALVIKEVFTDGQETNIP